MIVVACIASIDFYWFYWFNLKLKKQKRIKGIKNAVEVLYFRSNGFKCIGWTTMRLENFKRLCGFILCFYVLSALYPLFCLRLHHHGPHQPRKHNVTIRPKHSSLEINHYTWDYVAREMPFAQPVAEPYSKTHRLVLFSLHCSYQTILSLILESFLAFFSPSSVYLLRKSLHPVYWGPQTQ